MRRRRVSPDAPRLLSRRGRCCPAFGPSGRRCRSSHFRSEHSGRTPLSSGEPRTGPGGKPQESRRGSRESRLPVRSSFPWSAARPASPRPAEGKRRRGGPGKPGPRRAGIALERQETHGSIDSSGPRLVAGTDLRGEQSPEAAGHRQLLVLRAGARDAGNGRRAAAPKGVRLHGGGTLRRVNPMSGTGLRDRKARGGGNRPEGAKP